MESKSRKPLVAGNWKMNGSIESVAQLASGIVSAVAEDSGVLENCEVVVAPVSVHIDRVSQLLKDSGVGLSAQNVNDNPSGAFTGEVSVGMLSELGCGYVILGHSERRTLFSETDENIAAKVSAVVGGGLVPVLCVGETLQEREANQEQQVVKDQLVKGLASLTSLDSVVIAYEPVWAIGTGLTASPEQAQEMHGFIRDVLASIDQENASGIRILYGGSVKPDNANELFAQADIDGGLIGGASLKADDFLAICRAVG